MLTDHNHRIYRRARLRGITIEHPRFVKARTQILDAWELGKLGADPGFVALIGPSRTGKTRLMDTVYEHIMGGVKGQRPKKMLRIRLHDEAVKSMTVKSVVRLLLGALEEGVVRGETTDLRQRAKSGSIGLGVEIVEVDEAQHLVRDRQTATYSLASGVRTLIDDIAKPFVLVGTEALNPIIGGNEQILGRMIDCVRLQKFDDNDPVDYAHFIAFLLRYDQELPFDEWCFLWHDPMAHALYVASDGLVGHVVSLIAKAGGLAIDSDAGRIEAAHLAAAWQILRGGFTTLKKNPFDGVSLPPPRLKAEDGFFAERDLSEAIHDLA